MFENVKRDGLAQRVTTVPSYYLSNLLPFLISFYFWYNKLFLFLRSLTLACKVLLLYSIFCTDA